MKVRGLRIVLAALAVSAGAMIAFAAWLIETPAGTAWAAHLAADHIDGLEVDNVAGSVAEGVTIARAGWHNSDVDVQIHRLRFRLQWPALLRGKLLLREVYATSVSVDVAAGPAHPRQPKQLPTLVLPLTLAAPELAVDGLTVGNAKFTALQSSATWSGATLRLAKSRMTINGVTLSGKARLKFRQRYPLAADLKLTGENLPTPVHVITAGDLQQLQIDADTADQWPLRAHAVIATLASPIRLELSVHQAGPMRWPVAGATAEVYDATLSAAGTIDQLQGRFSAALALPKLGRATLSGAVSWREPQLAIDRWRLESPAGSMSGQCQAEIGGRSQGSCNGRFERIALDPWLPDIKGSLSSDFAVTAQLLSGRTPLTAALSNIEGEVNGIPVTGATTITTDDARLWHLQPLQLAIGANHLHAVGDLGSRYDLKVNLDATDLSQLPVDLKGALKGSATVRGSWPDLSVNAVVKGGQLQWQQWHAGSLRARIDLADAGARQSRLSLNLADTTVGGSPSLGLNIDAVGNRSAQQLTAVLTHKAAAMLSLHCDQRLQGDGRRGRFTCPQLEGALPATASAVAWHQQSQLQGQWSAASREFTISPLCLVADKASLCWRKPLQYKNDRLLPTTIAANAIPLQWWRGYLPSGLALQDDPRAQLLVTVDGLRPLNATADLRINRVRWQWPGHANAITGLDQVTAHAAFTTDSARFTASAHSRDLGTMQAALTVTEPTGARELSGAVQIAGLKLSGFAWAIEGIDKLAGTADADLTIGGRLDAPTVSGRVYLADGRLQWGPMPQPLENIRLTARFDQRHIAFNGGFEAAGGSGHIDGNLDWHALPAEWHLKATASADKLTLVPLPDSTVTLSGKVALSAGPGLLNINGSAHIAKAEIQLHELPPESVGVSPDVEIVGRQAPQTSWKIRADGELDLGDKFHFSGFGADVDLAGKLRLREQPGQPFKVSGEVTVPQGRYRAYGQRLKIRKGSFIFDGPWDNPNLQLEAIREMPPTSTTVVGLRVTGPLQDPTATLFSDPSMPETEMAYYFLTGKPPPETGKADRASAGSTLLSLSVAGGSGEAAKLAEKFGISEFRVGTVQTETGPEAELSGYITPQLFVSYGTAINRASGEFVFQYQLTSKLAIEAVSGLQQSLDLLYSFSVK